MFVLQDVFIDPLSVSKFVAGMGPPLDKHLWPASFKFGRHNDYYGGMPF